MGMRALIELGVSLSEEEDRVRVNRHILIFDLSYVCYEVFMQNPWGVGVLVSAPETLDLRGSKCEKYFVIIPSNCKIFFFNRNKGQPKKRRKKKKTKQ